MWKVFGYPSLPVHQRLLDAEQSESLVPSSSFGDTPGLLPTLSLQRRLEPELDAAPAMAAEEGSGEGDGMDAEQRRRLRRRVWLAVRASLAANALLTTIWAVTFALTRSYAFLAALADCGMDVANQLVLAFAARAMHKRDVRFPAGRTRLEPMAICINAVSMIALSLEVARVSSAELLVAFRGHSAPYHLTVAPLTIAIVAVAVLLKASLCWYCIRLRRWSGTALALAEDHRNDVLANVMAMAAAASAAHHPRVWWLDPAGALVIATYIIISWFFILRQQVLYVVGVAAAPELVERIRQIAHTHHRDVTLDALRVYHSGRHVLVELEVVMPPQTPLQLVHDVSLDLQSKVEKVHEVERAFVHVDYSTRGGVSEHKEPRLL